jgi:hypothetical protein
MLRFEFRLEGDLGVALTQRAADAGRSKAAIARDALYLVDSIVG